MHDLPNLEEELDEILDLPAENRIRAVFKEIALQAGKSNRSMVTIQILSMVVVPAAVAFFVNIVAGSDDSIKYSAWIAIGFLLIVQAGLFAVSLMGPTTPANIVVAYDRLLRQREGLIARSKLLLLQRNSYGSAAQCDAESLEIARDILNGQANGTQTDLEKDLEAICTPYLTWSDYVFNITNETANFIVTVFILDGTTLKPMYQSSCDSPRKREWPLATSHVGQAVTQQRPIITGDLHKSAEYLSEYDATDRERYRALASVPFKVNGETKGAVCISSDSPHVFNEEDSLDVFKTFAAILGLYLSYKN
ncbi:MAG TPA: GAF domain-containing protein [Fimbriimonadaceae bacterium]|jgi:putative methionine-R-sulfoxide reductase with GAF domain